jgi:hypothetical protein
MPALRARSHAALRPHAPESARHSHLLAILEDLPLMPLLARETALPLSAKHNDPLKPLQ